MKKNGFTTGQVAAAYIGTVVGAGFASGQEVLQFFTRFGLFGIFGLILVTALFYVFGAIIMDLGRKVHAQSHVEIIRYTGGKAFGTVIDGIITVSLFTTQAAMLAGTGALFAQEFQIPAMWGGLMMAVLTAFTVLYGIKGVVNANSVMVPLLLIIVIGTSALSFVAAPPSFTQQTVTMTEGGLVGNWLSAAILYVSCNSVLSISVLGPMGNNANGNKAIRYGALLGGIGLGAGAPAPPLMIHLAMTGYGPGIAQYEIPMVHIAGTLSKVLRLGYMFALIIAIYTTAVGALYGFAARFADTNMNRGWFRAIVIFATFAALLSSNWGFMNMVKYLYPIKGYIGIVILICLLWSFLKMKKKRNSVVGL